MNLKWTQRIGMICLAGLCLVQAVVILVVAQKLNSSPAGVPQASRAKANLSAETQELRFPGQPGSWGKLEYVRIQIGPPDEFVPQYHHQHTTTRWFFPNRNAAQLESLLRESSLTPSQITELTSRSQMEAGTDGIWLTPGNELVLGLTAEARIRLYSVLAETPKNDFHFWPCTSPGNGPEAWFERSGLSPATLALFRRLIYRRDGVFCFSDLPLAMSLTTDGTEQNRLYKTVARNTALLMKLHITEDSNVDALTAWWALGGRAKDVRPLLASLANVRGGVLLDVAHLLPPFARKRLNTFPVRLPPGQPEPNCYWTAFNFFNDPAENRFYEIEDWKKELDGNYMEVSGQPRYGDIVFLIRPDGNPEHAAVYIADDVVFTKNGSNLLRPWLLMKLADMLACYPRPHPYRLLFFRQKSLH
jgi:hypothetical protein